MCISSMSVKAVKIAEILGIKDCLNLTLKVDYESGGLVTVESKRLLTDAECDRLIRTFGEDFEVEVVEELRKLAPKE